MGDRRSLGLAGLDAQLGGGAPPGSALVLLGEPMNAFELFTYHFAAATPAGEPCRFVTQADAAEVRAGVAFVGGATDRIEVLGVPQANAELAPAAAGRYILADFSAYAAVVGWDAAFAALPRLRTGARRAGGLVLVCALSGLHTEAETTLLRHWADGVFELGFDRQGFGLYGTLKVSKLRGVPDAARILLFKETERGLFLESTRRVF